MYSAEITIKYMDEEKNKIKDDAVFTEYYSDGAKFTLKDEYTKDFAVKTSDGMYNHYKLNEGTSVIPPEYSDNMTVTLSFNNDEQYDFYENFENYTLDTAKWHKRNKL